MSNPEIPQFLKKEAIIERVTERRWEVLGCVANGMTNEQTAKHLEVSTHTVEGHLEHICDSATLYGGVSRSDILAPIIVEGIEAGRIVVDDVPARVKFTRLQLVVKDMMLEGQRCFGVASKLSISPRTAEVHFTNIYRKLRANNYYHAIAKLVAYRVSQSEQEGRRELEFTAAIR